jgi:hypothetical protein
MPADARFPNLYPGAITPSVRRTTATNQSAQTGVVHTASMYWHIKCHFEKLDFRPLAMLPWEGCRPNAVLKKGTRLWALII